MAAMRPVFLALGLLPALALLSTTAHAVGTRIFELDTIEKLSGGDLKGVAIGSDGVVRAGWTLGDVPLPDSGAASWAAVRLADKSVLVGATGGKVFRIVGETATVYADTAAQAVTSLAVGPNGVAYAGTMPDGKVFKLAQGKADLSRRSPTRIMSGRSPSTSRRPPSTPRPGPTDACSGSAISAT